MADYSREFVVRCEFGMTSGVLLRDVTNTQNTLQLIQPKTVASTIFLRVSSIWSLYTTGQ